MSQHPETKLSLDDIPLAVQGARIYSIAPCCTGGTYVIALIDGETAETLNHKPSDQAALREAIRLQKRENAKVVKEKA